MLEFRFYFFFIALTINILATILLFSLNIIFAIIFLVILIIQSFIVVLTYVDSILWPYHKMIDTSCIELERVKILASEHGKSLYGIILREKNSDRSEKHIGVLFHHGYTGMKEKMLRLAIPLAMNGCVVLCPDARGHGETVGNGYNINDWKGIAFDVEKEVDFLENLEDVDKDRLVMMGHSMGAILTLVAGYQNDRLRKLVAISGTYEMTELFKRHKTLITRGINKRLSKYAKKDPEFIASGETFEEWRKKIAPKYAFNYESPIPDKDRVYLVHCKQDSLILFDQSTQIKERLGLPDENVLFLEMPPKKYPMAAHNLTGQSSIIATFCVKVALGLK